MKLTHMQVQLQLEAQQAQHAAQTEDMSSKAAQMESLIRQATELDQQHATELNACEADLDELRQVDRVCVCVCVCVHSGICLPVQSQACCPPVQEAHCKPELNRAETDRLLRVYYHLCYSSV